MGLLHKATEIVGGATQMVGDTMGGSIPDLDLRKLREVVDLVWNNRDALVDLVTRLPSLLGDAGESMHLAGQGAQQVSGVLSNQVLARTTEAADTLDALSAPLAQVSDVLIEVGNMLVRIPLLGNVAAPVTRGLMALSEVKTAMDVVSVQIRSIGTDLADVGTGLEAMGGSLMGSGAALATLSGRSLAGSAKATRPAPATSSTAAPARAKAPAAPPAAAKTAAAKTAAGKPAAAKPGRAKKAAPAPSRPKPAASRTAAKGPRA